MAGIIRVTDGNFESEVLEAEMPVFVDFYADWCGPCKMMAPIVEELANEFDGRAKIAKLDVDANPKISATYGIRSIPTLVIFDAGRPVARVAGVIAKTLLKKGLEDVIAKDKAA